MWERNCGQDWNMSKVVALKCEIEKKKRKSMSTVIAGIKVSH